MQLTPQLCTKDGTVKSGKHFRWYFNYALFSNSAETCQKQANVTTRLEYFFAILLNSDEILEHFPQRHQNTWIITTAATLQWRAERSSHRVAGYLRMLAGLCLVVKCALTSFPRTSCGVGSNEVPRPNSGNGFDSLAALRMLANMSPVMMDSMKKLNSVQLHHVWVWNLVNVCDWKTERPKSNQQQAQHSPLHPNQARYDDVRIPDRCKNKFAKWRVKPSRL